MRSLFGEIGQLTIVLCLPRSPPALNPVYLTQPVRANPYQGIRKRYVFTL